MPKIELVYLPENEKDEQSICVYSDTVPSVGEVVEVVVDDRSGDCELLNLTMRLEVQKREIKYHVTFETTKELGGTDTTVVCYCNVVN